MKNLQVKTTLRKKRKRLNSTKILWFIICLFWSFILLYPITIMIIRSLETSGIGNYVYLFRQENVFLYYKNSIIVTSLTVVCVLTSASLAAYAFSKMNFHLKDALFYFALVALMVPPAAIIVPIFQIIKTLGLINNIFSLVGPYTSIMVAYSLLIIKHFMDDLPNELMEAAHIDGCSKFGIFCRIILPLSKPALVVVLIWVSMMSWNEFLFPLVFLRAKEAMTITVVPVKLFGEYHVDIAKVYAVCALIALPIMVLYIFMQRYFEKGFIGGAVKG